ncbi:phage portal protein [Streptomyces sp. NPDC059224]|uniref:phage portal protein n=1 Tax=Streptomyces sp. NPDC059224 TaxID=3346775 RepID=UPI0036741DE9
MTHNRNRALRRAAETRAAFGIDTLRDRMPITVASVGGQQSLTMALDAEARGYAHSAVAYRCVAAIADNGSSVPLAVARPDGSYIEGHEVAQLFNKRPNPFMSARAFKSLMLQQAELAGQSFVWLNRGETGLGPITEAHLVFDRVDVIVDKPLAQRPTIADLLGFVIRRTDGVQVPVLPEEMLWLRYPHPFDPLGCLAPWKAARHAVDMDAYAREWQRSSYANGARPSNVVYLGDMEEREYNQTVAAWRSSMQGPGNAGKSLFVRSQPGSGGNGGKGIAVERMTFTPEEMEYLESRMANAAEVMLAFGIPHDYLSAGTTYENRAAAKTTLWSDTIVPKLEMIASEIDLRLLPSDAEDAEFDLSGVDALRESRDAVVTRTTQLTEADIVMLDEARAEAGYDPLPGGIGQQTLTAYRSQYEPAPATAAGTQRLDTVDLEAIVTRVVTSVLAPLMAPMTQLDARPAPRRLELLRADDAPSSPSIADINAAYDELEGAGRRAVQALAREQRERVLRDFDRLMKKPERSAAWLGEVRTEACALAREQQLVLAPPDPEQVPAARLTDLDVASGPEGWEERIKLRDFFDGAYWRRQTAKVLRPFVERAWKRGGASITADFDLDEPTVADALRDRIEELAGQVTATTEQVLRSQVLAHGVAEGESVPELRARIQQVFTNLGDYRATMIARTETVGGYNQASFLAALDAGATTKTWLATDDQRTRETHRQENGRSAPMNKRFTLTKSRWPADPSAPAAQSIQCRCALTYQFEES